MSDLSEKVLEIKKRHRRVSDELIRAKERLSSEETAKKALLKKIKDAGYDPKKLKTTLKEKETELNTLMEQLEESLNDAEAKLEQIDN